MKGVREGGGGSRDPSFPSRAAERVKNCHASWCRPGDSDRSRGRVQERIIPRILSVPESFRDSVFGHPADVWMPRFQTRSSPREGGRMPCFFLLQCRRNCKGEQARFNNMFRNMTCGSNEPDLPSSCIKVEEKESRHPPSFRWSGTGLKPPSDRTDGLMTFRGVIEGFGNGEALRFGRPGQHKSSRWCEFRPEAREWKRTSRLSPPPPRPPAKEIKLASVTGFRKAEFSICLSEPFLRRAYP